MKGMLWLGLRYQRLSTDGTHGHVLSILGSTFPARLAVGFHVAGLLIGPAGCMRPLGWWADHSCRRLHNHTGL